MSKKEKITIKVDNKRAEEFAKAINEQVIQDTNMGIIQY